MDLAEKMDVARELMGFVREGTTQMLDEPMRIPLERYRSQQRFEAEMEAIFASVPLGLALTCELREPGQFVTRNVLDRPVLITRGQDGEARAFLNVCRHRGAVVETRECGQATRFSCPYHAWTYDDTGALVAVTDAKTFGDLDRSTHGLRELPTQERSGFVWVVLTPGGAIDVDEWLGDYADELAMFDLPDLHLYERRVLAGPNWKIAYDGYLDGYHLGVLHKDNLGKRVMNNRTLTRTFGPHCRISFAQHAIKEMLDQPEESWDLDAAFSQVYTVFPHMSLAGNGGDFLMVSQLFPGPGWDRSTTVQSQLVRKMPQTPTERDDMAARVDLYEHVVTHEDYATGIAITNALGAGANDEFVYGRNEPGNQNFHTWVNRLVDQPS